MSAEPHIPVMLAQVAQALRPGPGRLMVDATFGAGGYSRAFLAAGSEVAAFDRDPAVRPLAARFETEGSFRFFLAPFSAMAALLGEGMADGVAMDLGVSSMQLEAAERGFSLRRDGPLDMRMGEGGRTAAEIVNSASEAELATIFRDFGEEPRARAVARAIVRRRQERPFTRTLELAEAVSRAKGGPRGARIHPATRVFQALRIAVNGELQELAAGLEASERCLRPGGALAVVSFHSLEDRMVKTFISERSGEAPLASRHAPPQVLERRAAFRPLFRGAKVPAEEEIAGNPRARSARLRAAVRLGESDA